ncbi:MAG: hypothetical protein J3R72DRAFT_500243 [Linnemannia gamsii]|nr:MAG: hypothetical protein J3R72DRAFT_500243 [Linnemannia gamsii]
MNPRLLPLREKVNKSKKIVTFEQNQDGVTLAFDDSTTARGDVLVGADGGHSAVRQHLYKALALDKEGVLPKSDTKGIGKGYISLGGTTNALDTIKYPGLLKGDSECHYVIGDKNTPYTEKRKINFTIPLTGSMFMFDIALFQKWINFTAPENRICWDVFIQLGLEPVADEQIKNSDWTPQQRQKKVLDSIRHFRTPKGTLGDMFDAIPLEQICKVVFEDMLFNTWNPGRTVFEWRWYVLIFFIDGGPFTIHPLVLTSYYSVYPGSL